MRVLALDYGRTRCGVALSDPTGTLATPQQPIERPGEEAGMARIAELVRDLEVKTVVVGLPLTLRGENSDQTRETREFAARLAEAVAPVPVALADERLTTAQARRSGGRADEHSRAAAHLLEAWLVRRG
jgi:putative Holliday junction resolvase